MEKQFGWAHKLGWVESLGISKVGQTVLARLIECSIQHQSASSVGGGFSKGTMASVCYDPDTSASIQHATGAPQAATPSLEPRWSDSE